MNVTAGCSRQVFCRFGDIILSLALKAQLALPIELPLTAIGPPTPGGTVRGRTQHSQNMSAHDPAMFRGSVRRIGFTEWPHDNQTLTKFRG